MESPWAAEAERWLEREENQVWWELVERRVGGPWETEESLNSFQSGINSDATKSRHRIGS